MKYAIEMDSGARYTYEGHKNWFRHSKVDGGAGEI
jgi:hypothetical protein